MVRTGKEKEKKEEDKTAEVIEFTGVTTLDLPADRILQRALDKNLSEVVIVGYDQDGEFYFASSAADGSNVLWLLEGAKAKLIKIGFFND